MLLNLRKSGLLLLCVALFAIGTFAKVVQYYPRLDAQLRISNSTKIEKHQFDTRSFEIAAAAESSVASNVPIILEQPETRLIRFEPEALHFESFDSRITSRPPPFQN